MSQEDCPACNKADSYCEENGCHCDCHCAENPIWERIFGQLENDGE